MSEAKLTESREERKERERQEWVRNNTPKCCPMCGSTELQCHLTTWFAHSMEEQDLHNTAELAEHQCEGCCRAFWV